MVTAQGCSLDVGMINILVHEGFLLAQAARGRWGAQGQQPGAAAHLHQLAAPAVDRLQYPRRPIREVLLQLGQGQLGHLARSAGTQLSQLLAQLASKTPQLAQRQVLRAGRGWGGLGGLSRWSCQCVTWLCAVTVQPGEAWAPSVASTAMGGMHMLLSTNAPCELCNRP